MNRTKNLCTITYDEFYHLYIEQNLTCSEIAKLTGFTKDQIYFKKEKFGIIKDPELFRQCMNRISSSAEFQEAVKNTNMKKYGVPYAAQIPGAMEKRADSNLQKYGVRNVMQLPENIQKQHLTNIKKYGGVSPMSDPNIGQKRVNTVREKYGVDNVFQDTQIKKKSSRRYYYDNEMFDSSWELALWIYAKDHGEKIKREPCKIMFEVNKKKHYYFPDFSYKDQLVEIKGPHLLKNNIFSDAYNRKDRELIYQLKQADMIKRGISIWGQKDIQPYLDYVKKKYGKNYMRQFKLRDLTFQKKTV